MKGTDNSQDMCPRCMTPLQGRKLCPKCKFDPSTYTPAKHHLPPRTILDGKYLVGCVLGEGGFGITYVGWDLQLHTMVAIKEYFPTGIVFRDNTQSNVVSVFSGTGEDYYHHDREKFIEEAQMLAKFDSNPGVVSVKNYFKENGTAYIVMEYVQGINLAVLMEQNNDKLPYDRVMKLLEQPVKTLSEMHRQHTYHRDISPENLMVTNDNEVKLIDFGSTKTNEKDKTRYLKVRPGYSPLELYTSGGQEGPYSDIYSLSATIYKAVTGITPPPATDRINEDTLIPPIKAGAKGMSPSQEKALMKGLAVKAQDRYQRVEDLYAGLKGSKSKAPSKQRKPEKRFPVKTVAIGCAAAIALGGGLLAARLNDAWPFTKPEPAPEATVEPVVTDAPTEAPEQTEAPVAHEERIGDYAGVEPYALTEKAFDAVPEYAEALARGEDAPYEIDCCISSSGMWFVPADDSALTGWTTVHTTLSGDNLAKAINGLYASGYKVRNILLRGWKLETLQPLARRWPYSVGVVFNNCVLPDDWTMIEDMGDSLNLMHIEGVANVGDLSCLASLPNVEFLTINWFGDTQPELDMNAIGQHDRLRGLWLSNLGIEDLSPLSGLTQLEELGLHNNNCADLSPLSGMGALRFLQVSMNPSVTDLAPLAGLTALEHLSFERCDVQDIAPLAGLERLNRVDLGYNRIEDMSPVDHVSIVTGRHRQRRDGEPTGQGEESSEPWWTSVDAYPLREDMFSKVPVIWDQYNTEERSYWYNVRANITPDGLKLTRTFSNGRSLEYMGFDGAEPVQISGNQLASVLNSIADLPVAEIVLQGWKFETLEPLGRAWPRGVSVYLLNCELPDGWTTALDGMADSLNGLYIDSRFEASDLSALDSCPNLTELFLSRHDNYDGEACCVDLDAIGGQTQLTHLDLQAVGIGDCSALAGMTHLDFLGLSGNRVVDLSPLAGMSGLTFINIDDNDVSDLSPLAGLTNLEGLYAKRNRISDLSPLTWLPKLTHVELDGNRIADFSPIQQAAEITGQDVQLTEAAFEAIPELYQAYVNGEAITEDLQVVFAPEGMRFERIPEDNSQAMYENYEGAGGNLEADMLESRLCFIDSIDLPVRRIVFLAWDWTAANVDAFARDWRYVRELEFEGCWMPEGQTEALDWGGIAAMGDKLERLEVHGACDLDHLDWLTNCPNLVCLRLNLLNGGGIPEHSLEVIGGLRQLIDLELRNMELSDISSLGGLSGLHSLDLIDNHHIENIDIVAGMPELESLALDNNNISDLSPVAGLVNLRYLSVGMNPIRDAGPLAGLTNLEHLALCCSDVSDISPLAGLTNLTGLELNDNHISDLSPLSGLTQLNMLSLANNEITDVSPLGGLKNLVWLNLNDNQIADFEPVRFVAELIGEDAQQGGITREKTFAACPDVYDALVAAMGDSAGDVIRAEDFQYNDINVTIRPEGVTFYVRSAEEPWSNLYIDDAPRQPLSGERLTAIVDALCASRLPIANIVFDHCGFESLRAIGRSWTTTPWMYFTNCDWPDDALESLAAVDENLFWLYAENLPCTDLNWLSGHPSLHGVQLFYSQAENTRPDDASALAAMQSMEYLDLPDCYLTDLTFVSGMTYLSCLNIDGNRVSDLSPLANLGALEMLCLQYNRITDLSPLAGLSKLNTLTVAGNMITDFGPVAHVQNIDGQDMQGIAPTPEMFAQAPEAFAAYQSGEAWPYELGALINENGLTFSRFTPDGGPDNRSQDVERVPIDGETLNRCINTIMFTRAPVVTLDLNNLALETLAPMVRTWPGNNISLEFYNCTLPDDWSALQDIRDQLIFLSVNGTFSVDDIGWLAGMYKLQWLALYNISGEIRTIDVGPIAQIGPQLTTLYLCNYSDVQSLDALRSLPLQRLGLTNMELTDLSILDGMTKLSALSLDYNKDLTDISPLAGMEALRELNLYQTQVSDLSPLANLPNLEYVNVIDCPVSDYSPVDHVANVEGRRFVLTEAMFEEAPEAWTILAQGGSGAFPYRLCAAIDGDGLHIRHMSDEYTDYGPRDQGAPRGDLSANTLSTYVRAILEAGLPVRDVCIYSQNLETATPLCVNWPGEVQIFTYDCGIPDDWSAWQALGDKLTWLQVEGDFHVGNLEWLTSMNNLLCLSLHPNDINTGETIDFSLFARMPRLCFLFIGGNYGIDSIEPLRGHSLDYLQVANNPVSDLSPLEDMKNLCWLDISQTNVTDISALKDLTNLETVFLQNCNIADYSPVDHVPEVYGRP